MPVLSAQFKGSYAEFPKATTIVTRGELHDAPVGFAEKWATARRFYASDLASGFVRVQAELWAAAVLENRHWAR